MNTSVRTSDLQRWQQCAGMCLICGQPLGLSISARERETVRKEDKEEEKNEEEIQLERLTLAEECPIRLCMMRFFMLGKREECHIIDQYTHLEKRSSDEHFERVFEKKRNFFTQTVGLHPAYSAFAREVPASEEMTTAISTCRRVANPLTFSGCRACNMAMEKSAVHANAIYRCFPLTAHGDVPALEINKQESVQIKKVLEQIALFFVWTDEKWRAKTGTQLIADTCLWRCIAHLYTWGRNAKWRSRAVAVFHAANYMYFAGGAGFQESLSLEDWHMHVFQPFYMARFHAGTWFGVSEQEIAVRFDFARKDGKEWIAFVVERLTRETLPALLTWFETEVRVKSIQDFKRKLSAAAKNEQALVRFVGHQGGIEEGLTKWLRFHLFQISTEPAVQQHSQKFIREMGKAFRTLQHGR